MPDSLDLGPEAGINARLAVLRQRDIPAGPLRPDAELAPGIVLNTDPAARIAITATSPPGLLLSARLVLDGPARWITLNLDAGDCDLAGRMLFGVAVRSVAPRGFTFRLGLRSHHAGGFTDTFFRKTVIAHAEASLHLDALMTSEHEALRQPVTGRELVLFLQAETGSLDLQDLRVFVI